MPNRASSFASALLGGACTVLVLLAATMLLGPNVTASAADECLESPGQTTQPGRWYYHTDRTLNRRCWFFHPSEPQQSDERSSEVRPPAQQPQGAPPRFSAPEEPTEPAKIASPKYPGASKVSRQPQAAPSPTTSGDASAGRQDQTQPVAAGKDEKQPPLPLNVAERESLFLDFMKWQRERALFGDRW
jgi:hypothetical protein